LIINGVGSCGDHLRNQHAFVPLKETVAKASVSVFEQLQGGVVVAPFSPEVFRQKLLRFFCVCHVPFAVVEQRCFYIQVRMYEAMIHSQSQAILLKLGY
jgi:hypothetical protein